MASKPQGTAWSREDRDLLVELRTRLISVEASMQEVKTGVTARLLNLEANSVNKLELQNVEIRLEKEVLLNAEFRSKATTYGSIALLVVGLAATFLSKLI